MFVQNRLSQLVLFIIMAVITVMLINRTKKGVKPFIRTLAAIDAIPEAIGSAAEKGKPIVFTPGCASLYDSRGSSQTLAGLMVLSYVAEYTAKLDVPLLIGLKSPEVIPVADQICYEAYAKEGVLQSYNSEETVRYLSNSTFGYSSGVLGLIAREKPGALIYIGSLYAESIIMAGAAHGVGAMQISGTANTSQMPFILAACDYALIGEEIYAAGATISQDPVQLGSIAGQDISKGLLLILLIVGAVLATLEIDFLANLLGA